MEADARRGVHSTAALPIEASRNVDLFIFVILMVLMSSTAGCRDDRADQAEIFGLIVLVCVLESLEPELAHAGAGMTTRPASARLPPSFSHS